MVESEVAVREINLWRGECMNLFARGERAVGGVLESAALVGKVAKIRHLAGQQLSDLRELAEGTDSTDKQRKALHNALEQWQEVESQRQFLAHGVTSHSWNERGEWTLLLDIVTYRGGKSDNQRWAIKKSEAEEFLNKLSGAFNALSQQLGHLKSRFAT